MSDEKPKKTGRLAWLKQIWVSIRVPLAAIILALLVGALILIVSGVNPLDAYAALFKGAFGNEKYLQRTLEKATPLIFSGLAVTFAFKAGLFNVGAQGQLLTGALASAALGFLINGLPPIIHIAIALLGGAIVGALYGAIAGVLRTFTGAHEVITTIMLNYIAINITDYFADGPFKDATPGNVIARTPKIADSAIIKTIYPPLTVGLLVTLGILIVASIIIFAVLKNKSWGIKNKGLLFFVRLAAVILIGIGLDLILKWVAPSFYAQPVSFLPYESIPIPIGFLIAVATSVVVWFVLMRTSFGFEIRTVGLNYNAAKYAGMRVRLIFTLAMVISGFLAGMGGAVETQGVVYRFQPGFNAGLGFDGITIALLGRNNPLGIIPAALLVGAMNAGSNVMQFDAGVPTEIIDVIQALMLFFVAADMIVRWIIGVKSRSDEDKLKLSTGWGK